MTSSSSSQCALEAHATWSSFVSNRQTSWLLYNDALTWGVRPSKLLNIKDPYTQYCFDQAINYWGKYVEGQLDRIEGDDSAEIERKRTSRLSQLLYPDAEEAPPARTGQFADPALLFA